MVVFDGNVTIGFMYFCF